MPRPAEPGSFMNASRASRTRCHLLIPWMSSDIELEASTSSRTSSGTCSALCLLGAGLAGGEARLGPGDVGHDEAAVGLAAAARTASALVVPCAARGRGRAELRLP